MRFGQKLGPALAKAQRLAAGSLHLPRKKYPDADQGDERQPRYEQRDEPRHVVLLRSRGNRHAFAVEPLDQRVVVGRIGLEAAAVGEGAMNLRSLNHDIADAALIHLIEELREGDVLRGSALTRVLKQGEESKQEQDNDHPQGEIAQIGIHALSFKGPPPAAGAPAHGARGFTADSRPSRHNLSARQLSAKGTRIFLYYSTTACNPAGLACSVVKGKHPSRARRGALDHQTRTAQSDQRSRQSAAKPEPAAGFCAGAGERVFERVVKRFELA